MTPFFSARLLKTKANGTYEGIRSRRLVAAFEDRLVLGDEEVPYARLTNLRAYGNVLHVGYASPDGRQVEQYFKHDTFIPSKGRKALAAMVQRINAARATLARPTPFRAAETPVDPAKVVRVETTRDEGGWRIVALYTSMVAFPAMCPACRKPAETVVRYGDAMGFHGAGAATGWLVPCCHAHVKDIPKYVHLGNWRVPNARLQFAFADRDYASQFVTVNEGKDVEAIRRQASKAPLLYDLQAGKRIVVYQFAVSFIAVSMLQNSKFELLGPGESAFVRGLKYSAISFLAGWWAIPGVIFTIASIVRNCKGGVDLSRAVMAVLSGAAMEGGR